MTINARNRYGAYTCQQWHALLLHDNSIIDAYPKSTSPNQSIGLPAYDRMMNKANALDNQINAMSGTLMLNLCAEAVRSGRTSPERFPELEKRG